MPISERPSKKPSEPDQSPFSSLKLDDAQRLQFSTAVVQWLMDIPQHDHDPVIQEAVRRVTTNGEGLQLPRQEVARLFGEYTTLLTQQASDAIENTVGQLSDMQKPSETS